MIIVSIDIGMSGAAACIRPDGSSSVCDLPFHEAPDKSDKWLSGRGLLDILHDWVPAQDVGLVIVENVRPRPMGNGGRAGNTLHSQGSLMRGRGAVESACDIAGLKVCWVQPATWKRHFNLLRKGDENASAIKEKGRQMALTLFPGMAGALARKMDHNRADALLLAHWGRATQL